MADIGLYTVTLAGTADPQPFEASVAGVIHAAGLGAIVKLGSVHGDAVVSLTPPAIGTFLIPVTASFAVDANWARTGAPFPPSLTARPHSPS